MSNFLGGTVEIIENNITFYNLKEESNLLKKYFAVEKGCYTNTEHKIYSALKNKNLPENDSSNNRLEEIKEEFNEEVREQNYFSIDENINMFVMTILGGLCCCGGFAIKEELLPFLRYMRLVKEVGWEKAESEKVIFPEMLLKYLNKEDILEHGTSVYGSWLSKLGTELLTFLEIAEKEGALND